MWDPSSSGTQHNVHSVLLLTCGLYQPQRTLILDQTTRVNPLKNGHVNPNFWKSPRKLVVVERRKSAAIKWRCATISFNAIAMPFRKKKQKKQQLKVTLNRKKTRPTYNLWGNSVEDYKCPKVNSKRSPNLP
jgi:hypothetical protein